MSADDSSFSVILPDAAAEANSPSASSYYSDNNGAAMASAAFSGFHGMSSSAQAGKSLDSLLKTESATKLDMSSFVSLGDTRKFAAMVMNSEPLKAQIADAMEKGQSVTLFAPTNDAMAALPNDAFEQMKKKEFAQARSQFTQEHAAFEMDEKLKAAQSRMGGRAVFSPDHRIGFKTAAPGRHVAVGPNASGAMTATLFATNGRVIGSSPIKATLTDHQSGYKVHVLEKALSV